MLFSKKFRFIGKLNLPDYIKKSVEIKVNDKIQAWFYIFYSLMPILCYFVS